MEMSGRQWTIFGILIAVALGLAGLGFAAMSTNPPFTVPAWLPTTFFVVAGSLFIFSLAHLIFNVANNKKEKRENTQSSDDVILLQLLDEIYQKIRLTTEKTIDWLRDHQWQGINKVFEDVTGMNPDEVVLAIQYWTLKGVAQFMSGDEITVGNDAREMAEKIRDAVGSPKNPELLAFDLSLSIRHRFLDKRLKRDRTYDNLQLRLRRERDKFPDEAVSNAVDSFLDHSFKVNAVWIIAEYDLVGIPSFEKTFEYKILPNRIVLRVEDIPNQASKEMERFRNKVGVAINAYLKEKAGRIVHRK